MEFRHIQQNNWHTRLYQTPKNTKLYIKNPEKKTSKEQKEQAELAKCIYQPEVNTKRPPNTQKVIYLFFRSLYYFLIFIFSSKFLKMLTECIKKLSSGLKDKQKEKKFL